ncbi:MAG: penicillin-binding protein activator [Deltaproteobacteria bacterium]|nr:penicillin-binding protein activator [Deltaproteobacteria bacterium]
MVGVAFFLVSCQPKAPIPVKVEPVQPDPFAMAEEYRKAGDPEKALAHYRDYIETEPKGKKTPIALHRMADIYLALDEKSKAIAVLKQIEAGFPGYPELPEVIYQFAEHQYQEAQYEAARDAGLKWIERFPSDPLQRKVYILLGDSCKALEERPEAFKWWVKARASYPDHTPEAAQLDDKLDRLVGESVIEALEEMAGTAGGSLYAPRVYFKLASLYLAQDNLPAAREAANDLIASTDKAEWISSGNNLLKTIRERMAVREGVVGCLLPLTGPFAIYGKAVLNGIVLGSGIPGSGDETAGLELVIRDTKGDRQATLQALEELAKEDRVMAVIGPLSSKTAVAAAEKAQELHVPIITLTHKDGIEEIGNMVFRHLLSPAQEIDSLLDSAMGRIGFDRFAVLYPDNPYGRFCMNTFRAEVTKRGGMITSAEPYDPDETDFADPIRKLVDLYEPKPRIAQEYLAAMRIPEVAEQTILSDKSQPIIDFDAVFIPDNFERVAMIAPQLAFHDVLGVRLMGTSPWQSPKLTEMAGDHVQEALFPSGFFPASQEPGTEAFATRYRAYFDAPPGTLAATAYDTIRLLKKVIKANRVRTRSGLRDALLASEGFRGVTGSIVFTPEGEAKKTAAILTVNGSAFIEDPLFSAQ